MNTNNAHLPHINAKSATPTQEIPSTPHPTAESSIFTQSSQFTKSSQSAPHDTSHAASPTTSTTPHDVSHDTESLSSGVKKTMPTRCWTCRYATGLEIKGTGCTCPWATRSKPVAGWNAKRSIFKGEHNEKVVSYRVLECPLYAPDLEQQIKNLPYATLAQWLGFTDTTARVHNDICCLLLYYCIYRARHYERLIEAHRTGEDFATSENVRLLHKATEKNNEPYRLSLALARELPATPHPIDRTVLKLAFKDICEETAIDHEIDPTSSYTKYLLGEIEAIKNVFWHEKVKERKEETARIAAERKARREARKAKGSAAQK